MAFKGISDFVQKAKKSKEKKRKSESISEIVDSKLSNDLDATHENANDVFGDTKGIIEAAVGRCTMLFHYASRKSSVIIL